MNFTLELTYSGLILVDQHAAGLANHGLYLLMPPRSGHSVKLNFDPKDGPKGQQLPVRLSGSYDFIGCDTKENNVPANYGGYANLVEIEGEPFQKVHPDWHSGPMPNGFTRLRLPLPSSITPEGPSAELRFVNSAKTKTTELYVFGTAKVTMKFAGPFMVFDNIHLKPDDGDTLKISITNLPATEPPVITRPMKLEHHHIESLYRFLAAPGANAPVGPDVWLLTPAIMAMAGAGIDPAQCTNGGT